MSDTSTTESSLETQATSAEQPAEPVIVQPSSLKEPPPSYVKLAMRNMVKKGAKSLFHFTLTTVGFLALLVGLAYLTR